MSASTPKNALTASYKMAYRIAKCKKPIMVGECVGKLFSNVPTSTVRRKINHIAEDV